MSEFSQVLPGGRSVYRLWFAPMVLCAIYAAPLAWMAALALNLTPEPVPPNQQIVYGLIALPFLLLFVRTAMAGVYVGKDAITIRNVMRSWRLRHDDVQEFREGAGSNAASFGGSTAHLRDGRVVRIFALDPSMLAFGNAGKIVARHVAELNQRLAAHGTGHKKAH